jgi:glycosyltransferase involved in cell wall biosynthesis
VRFHVVSIPQSPSTAASLCPYARKVRQFCQMMLSLGHQVYHYGSGTDVPVTESVITIKPERVAELLPGQDWTKEIYDIDWDSARPVWSVSSSETVNALKDRLQPHDFICSVAGYPQRFLAAAFPSHMVVEFGIGYPARGIFSKYRVFESYAWMHYCYGVLGIQDGSMADCVIPGYFDPADYHSVTERGDYFLYVGRVTIRKGFEIASEVCKRIGAKLIVCGQKKNEIQVAGDHVEFKGTVDKITLASYMANARAVFVPTQYIGPFESVAAEAMLSGTPVICSDVGAFTENVEQGVTGFRCSTLAQYIKAARAVSALDPKEIRNHAMLKFSMHVAGRYYDAYFKRLLTLWGKGWYEEGYEPHVTTR